MKSQIAENEPVITTTNAVVESTFESMRGRILASKKIEKTQKNGRKVPKNALKMAKKGSKFEWFFWKEEEMRGSNESKMGKALNTFACFSRIFLEKICLPGGKMISPL